MAMLQEHLGNDVSLLENQIEVTSDDGKQVARYVTKIWKMITMADTAHKFNPRKDDGFETIGRIHTKLHTAVCTVSRYGTMEGSEAKCNSACEDAEKFIEIYMNGILAAIEMPRQKAISHERRRSISNDREETTPVGGGNTKRRREETEEEAKCHTEHHPSTYADLQEQLVKKSEECARLEVQLRTKTEECEHMQSKYEDMIKVLHNLTESASKKPTIGQQVLHSHEICHLETTCGECRNKADEEKELLEIAIDFNDWLELMILVIRDKIRRNKHRPIFSAKALGDKNSSLSLNGDGFSNHACACEPEVCADKLWKNLAVRTVRVSHSEPKGIAFTVVKYLYGLWYSVAQCLYKDATVSDADTIKKLWKQQSIKITRSANIISDCFPGRPNNSASNILHAPLVTDADYERAYNNSDNDPDNAQISKEHVDADILPYFWGEQVAGVGELARHWLPDVSDKSHENFEKVLRKLTGAILSLCNGDNAKTLGLARPYLDLTVRAQNVTNYLNASR